MTHTIRRRDFIAKLAKGGVLVSLAAHGSLHPLTHSSACAAHLAGGVRLPPVDAQYFSRLPENAVQCHLCPRQEILSPGQVGFCRSRINDAGVLRTYASGQPCVLNVDPVEKNPACHILPGTRTLTIAHAGCNLRCMYCQNFEFSQKCPSETRNLRFDRDESLQLAARKAIPSLTFTYTEGTTHIEFNAKLAEAARKSGLRVFLCTNGYVQARPLQDFLQLLDAVTVTIKTFSDATYKKYMSAESYKPVLDSCKLIRASGRWLEIATLIVPGVNDSDEELSSIARWMAAELGPTTPWHLERFVPKFMLANLPPTPVPVMERARSLGLKAGLKFVYISNVAPHEGNHTYCPKCGRTLIERLGMRILNNRLRNGRCPSCSTIVPGLWT